MNFPIKRRHTVKAIKWLMKIFLLAPLLVLFALILAVVQAFTDEDLEFLVAESFYFIVHW